MKRSELKLTVAGLWHLGSVTSACCARHFQVTAYDADAHVIDRLREGRAPIHEPGLDELVQEGMKSGRLRYTHNPKDACREADVLWCTWDTPVNDDDLSDVEWVMTQMRTCVAEMRPGTLVLVSSQLPVGSCRRIEEEFPKVRVACSPENLRLGKAIAAFESADRFVVGTRSDDVRETLAAMLEPFCDRIVWMRTESAEMVKHALNAFLALSVSFINEVAVLCEAVGADAVEVGAGLKSDVRIGERAYLKPGGPFAGGTLARDVVTLTRLAQREQRPLVLIPAVKESNDRHRDWSWDRLSERLGSMSGCRIAVLGLTYKPDTDTLRRSTSVELCLRLLEAGAIVAAQDPIVRDARGALPQDVVCPTIEAALEGAHAAVVSTEWEQYRQADWRSLIPRMRRPLLIDPNGFLGGSVSGIEGCEHVRVGCP